MENINSLLSKKIKYGLFNGTEETGFYRVDILEDINGNKISINRLKMKNKIF